MKQIKKIVFDDGEEIEIYDTRHVCLFEYDTSKEIIIDFNINKFEEIKFFSDKLARISLAFKFMHQSGLDFPAAMKKAEELFGGEFLGEFTGRKN